MNFAFGMQGADELPVRSDEASPAFSKTGTCEWALSSSIPR